MRDTHRILIRGGRVRMLVISLFFMTITITCVACSSRPLPGASNEAAFPFPLPLPISSYTYMYVKIGTIPHICAAPKGLRLYDK